MDFYLASASPRRAELLGWLDYSFEIIRPNIDETPLVSEISSDYVQRMAYEKALAGTRLAVHEKPVLAADTCISCEGAIFGKPTGLVDAQAMLLRLSGRTHQVMTAVCVAQHARHALKLVVTDVTMRVIEKSEIHRYWHSGEPCDKAGSYAIQGIGGKFIERIDGSYSAVVGLPLVESERLLKQFLMD